uniref:Thyroglobulin n=1 Tax=Podarcis muralis TaxID=64176 RepID=A0A670JRN4_PODMU
MGKRCNSSIGMKLGSAAPIIVQPLRPCELRRAKAFQEASYIPQCLDSGDFDPIQCDSGLGQCWCVDSEGMEVYGTRQRGKPKRCKSCSDERGVVSSGQPRTFRHTAQACVPKGRRTPLALETDRWQEQEFCSDISTNPYAFCLPGPGKCEIRDRRILHNVGEKSPPQCSADGEFLPVQCKFINTTDRMVFDLVHHFSRFPEAFLTFRSFSRMFPEVSGYCYCADSLGRELEDTGLEMLLENVYDTIFASLEPVPSFAETSMYRILQRRFLGVQLATTGRFRCPSKCETERSTAIRFEQSYRPTCDDNGAYETTQCQLDGQCWCVDANGQELLGTRKKGQDLSCKELTCVSERRRALSRLFYGPIRRFGQDHLFSSTQEPQRIAESSRSCPPSFKELFVDSGLLSSIIDKPSDSQLLALESTISEAIGGMFPSRDLARIALRFTSNPKWFQENLFGGKFLKNVVQFNFTGALGPNGKFNLDQYFRQRGVSGGFSELARRLSLEIPPERFNLSQPVIDSFGRTVNLQDNQNAVRSLASLLEAPEFFVFLQHVVSVPESIAEDLGDVVRIALRSKDCAEEGKSLFVPVCTEAGNYEEVQCYAGACWCVDSRGKEILGSRVRGSRPRCPTLCEKQREDLQRLQRLQPAGSELFVPSCTQEGKFLPVQCHGRNCVCFDSEGRTIPGKGATAEQPLQCPSDCQLAGGRAFLRTVQQLLLEPSSLPKLSSVYIPQCGLDGRWRQVQCNGPPEQTFEWYQRWISQNNNGRALPFGDLVGILLNYKERSQQSFEDFVKILYSAGHQKVFPEFAKFPSFDEVPQEVLEGKTTGGPSQNVLLEPFTFWQLLQGHLTHYPGSFSDFSTLLGHFDLRNCWCADERGQMQGKEADVNKIPDCPGECEATKRDAMQFVSKVEQLIKDSNSSHFPFGQSFLVAKGITLTDEELLSDISPSASITISEGLLTGSDYAIRLAAQSSMFGMGVGGWVGRMVSVDLVKQMLFLVEGPQLLLRLTMQGDILTGTFMTEEDYYFNAGQTPCQRSQVNALISGWRRTGLTFNVTSSDLFAPSCAEASPGSFSPSLSSSSKGPSYCKMLESKALLREMGRGYIPQCEGSSGGFSPVQRTEDQESSWCVFENGEEVPGTRINGKKLSCERPRCHLPFDAPYVTNGGVFCGVSDDAPTTQKCQVICSPGFHSVGEELLLCDTETGLWLGDPAHSQTCQRLQPFQSVQTQTHFQLVLPPEKTCGPDFSKMLEAFQIFILDEMKARGFCHIQVNAFGHLVSVPVCDDSSVLVQCLAADRLGVNITWRAFLEEVPAASLPDLHNIERAMVGDNLVGRFEALVKSGGFVLQLGPGQFQADTSISFLRNGTSPEVRLGCRSGFRKVFNAGEVAPSLQGCVVCPPGTSFQNDGCLPCPSGFYQDQAGSSSCIRCPLGKTTVSAGAFRAEHCVTDCQRDERAVRCEENGQYRPSFEDPATNKSFCMDSLGNILDWTETDGPVTDSQCSGEWTRQTFIPCRWNLETQAVVPTNGGYVSLLSILSECEKDESCGFLTLSAAGTGTLCELYKSNLVFASRHLPQSSNLDCRAPFLKMLFPPPSLSGQEFMTAGVKTFERTDFQDVVSGVYRNLVLSAAGTSLTDVHLFCRQACSQDACCDGFILSQVILDGGSIICGLMSYPDTFICNVNSWDASSTRERGDACQKVKYNTGKTQYAFSLGGQVLTGPFSSFQRVYLWRGKQFAAHPPLSFSDTSAREFFSLMESSQILIDHNRSLPSQEYWLFKPRYSVEQALYWCLARCVEDEFCQLVDMRNDTTGTYFPCILYPAAQFCDNFINNIPENCNIVLPRKPHLLYQKTVSLEGAIKNFYTRLPFRRVSGISVSNKMDVSGKTVSNGFFDCEHLCDADPCCLGFGLLNASQGTGGKVSCLVLNSLGIQTCSEEIRSDWQLSDCTSAETETRVHPFGWYQRTVPTVCPPVVLPRRQENVILDNWQRVDRASVLIDSSISKIDILHISRDGSSDFATLRDFCLSACSKDKSCLVTTLEPQPSVMRCIFYPETQTCTLGLEGPHCRLLLKEPATYIYRRQGKPAFLSVAETSAAPSVHIPSQGTLFGTSQAIRVGSSWKRIRQFLGIPYARPPVAEYRFRPPQAFIREESWNASTTRASCWQPGDDGAALSSISEDCLYLNIYVPPNTGGNLPVLVFFHNGVSGEDVKAQRTLIDGSYLAGTGNVIVVTANYRVGVFGFLSTGSTVASGNWGLLDQEAALKWTQKNIESFGGDPGQITIAADRSGADVSSIHLVTGTVDSGLFKRVLLMGGSAFSPASTISQEKARAQASILAHELGCPSASSEETVSCLRQLPAKVLNDAQTRLLAISGPFQYWSPVVDGVYLQEPLTVALQRSRPSEVDLLIGSAQQDGLISRAKAIKRFEVSQGRVNSKVAFYQALQNSLGGEDADPAVLDAATWFYSLTHSSTEYASFSRALENATRDQFIICPTIDMARHWAGNGRGQVFMYHVPDTSSLSSLELLPDVQYAFGLPFHPQYENQYTPEAKTLSLTVMQFLANFIRSGNPNGPYKFSRKMTGVASSWPMFRADADGDNYKEFTASFENHKGLKKAECSFWSDYIKTLKSTLSCKCIVEHTPFSLFGQ